MDHCRRCQRSIPSPKDPSRSDPHLVDAHDFSDLSRLEAGRTRLCFVAVSCTIESWLPCRTCMNHMTSREEQKRSHNLVSATPLFDKPRCVALTKHSMRSLDMVHVRGDESFPSCQPLFWPSIISNHNYYLYSLHTLLCSVLVLFCLLCILSIRRSDGRSPSHQVMGSRRDAKIFVTKPVESNWSKKYADDVRTGY
jgi:hypothetical protein